MYKYKVKKEKDDQGKYRANLYRADWDSNNWTWVTDVDLHSQFSFAAAKRFLLGDYLTINNLR